MTMEVQGIFSSNYLGPISYYAYLAQYQSSYQDIYENFVKQTYRNRCCVLSPNGVQNLTVPLIKARQRKLIKNVKIAYDDNWRKMHWKSLEAAYRSSPYFEYYEDDFYPFFHDKKYEFLIDLNWDLEQKIIGLINMEATVKQTTAYQGETEGYDDYRNIISPRIQPNNLNFKEYIQVFSDRNGFAPNMSIVDLLFNEGPNALSYLKEIRQHV